MNHGAPPPSHPVLSQAADWASIALQVIDTPYPWVPGHVVLSAADTDVTPHRLHPAFHGSLDWHSCVHMLWSLLTLAEHHGDALDHHLFEQIEQVLNDRLRADHLAVEVDYLRARPGFERPYGWAWAIQLAAAAQDSGLAGARDWTAALEPLVDLLATLVPSWLARQTLPVRRGNHHNDAFALSLLIDGFHRLQRSTAAEVCRERALEWFAPDTDAPSAWEPGGTDFLSPVLSQAELMTHLLPPAQVGEWLAGFLPGLGAGGHEHLLQPPQILDPQDGQFAHLLGLALSRAWQLRALAPHLGHDEGMSVRAGADLQEQSALPQITGGHFMATHWLVSFALLARGHGPAGTCE